MQSLHLEHAQTPAHEVFAQHFRLPCKGEEMAHSYVCYAFA